MQNLKAERLRGFEPLGQQIDSCSKAVKRCIWGLNSTFKIEVNHKFEPKPFANIYVLKACCMNVRSGFQWPRLVTKVYFRRFLKAQSSIMANQAIAGSHGFFDAHPLGWTSPVNRTSIVRFSHNHFHVSQSGNEKILRIFSLGWSTTFDKWQHDKTRIGEHYFA